MYFIGLDVHKKTISYCVKDAAGRVYQEGKIGATRRELDEWIRTMPQPRTIAMEATIFTGWIYDHLLPHAEKVKVAHPLMLRAIAAAKKKNDRIDAGKIADCVRCDFLPECHMASTEIRDRRRTLRFRGADDRQRRRAGEHTAAAEAEPGHDPTGAEARLRPGQFAGTRSPAEGTPAEVEDGARRGSHYCTDVGP
jgi:hypothetical protein